MDSEVDRAESPSVRYLRGRLALVEHRVVQEIRRLRELAGGQGGDGSPGFYASHRHVDRVLAADGRVLPAPLAPEARAHLERIEREADAAEAAGHRVRLRDLARTLALSPLESELLLVAVAPAVDDRFEVLYAHLNDDRTRRHATVGTAFRICGVPAGRAAAPDALGHLGPLTRSGVIDVVRRRHPASGAELVPRDRAVRHLLDSDVMDPVLRRLAVEPLPVQSATSQEVAMLLQRRDGLVYVRDDIGAGGTSAAAGALRALGHDVLALDLAALDPADDVDELARAAGCEAVLRDGGLVVGPIEELAARGIAAVRAITDLPVPLITTGRAGWDPIWASQPCTTVRATRIDDAERARVLADALGSFADSAADAAAWLSHLRLTPQQLAGTAVWARQRAEAQGRRPTREDLHAGARSQNATGLARLARRVEPQVTWDDLVLPPSVEDLVRELPLRWRHRHRVLDEWGVDRGVASGRGVSALFAGPSGTGKTVAAEVVAGELGLDLYVVDLSTVVDKYIGETSKNLERIFEQADRVNGVLLFDEADALFGKRSAVSDSKDRHANVEVAFLLQRMETFDGIAILTTNLAANLDDAFLRRLDTIVDFPAPTPPLRRAIWAAKLHPGLPLAPDVDLDDLAERFTMSGAEIVNAVVSAAFRAAERDGVVTARDLVAAAVREHRKLGRHLTAAELGEHADVLTE